MRRRWDWWSLCGFLFTLAAGTILHFAYGWWSTPAAAAFSAVNESVWEHMKLLFVPVFLWSVAELGLRPEKGNGFLAARGLAAVIGTLGIPVGYYTVQGIFGESPTWANLLLFALCAAAVFLLTGVLQRSGAFCAGIWQIIGFLLLWGGLFAFLYCTFRPPTLPLWQDPRNGLVGILP